MDVTKYLLRTPAQQSSFRAEFSRAIERNRDAWTRWVNQLPSARWCEYIAPRSDERTIRFTVGLICILYIDGYIDISFCDGGADKIIRYDPWPADNPPESEDENEEQS